MINSIVMQHLVISRGQTLVTFRAVLYCLCFNLEALYNNQSCFLYQCMNTNIRLNNRGSYMMTRECLITIKSLLPSKDKIINNNS